VQLRKGFRAFAFKKREGSQGDGIELAGRGLGLDMARVILEGVSKKFGKVVAVDGLGLEVEEREYLVLVGPSGCGKSTTLRLIAGLEHPTAGVVRIGERDVAKVPPRERSVALVFQSQPLFPHFSVRGNLAFGLKQRRQGDWPASIWKWFTRPPQAAGSAAKQAEPSVLVREAARELGVEHLLDRMPRQLSGGERQRVALGRAVVRNPAVFLFDEPLASLDANLRAELRGLLRRVHERSHAATIHVTHDQAEALALADRVAVMEGGRVRQVGAPLEVYDRPRDRFVASFIGDPPMNLLEGRLVENDKGVRLFAGGVQLEGMTGEETARRGDTVLGIRPEHLTLAPHETESGASSWRITHVEHLGDESRIHLEEARPNNLETSPVKKLIAKTKTRAACRAGEVVAARCEASQAHWFDPQTGERTT
jgi:multiple sugar transport system ATP-binding protein